MTPGVTEIIMLVIVRQESLFRSHDHHRILVETEELLLTSSQISTSLGIPDFRSKSNGFYSQLRELDIEEPEEVFALDRFDEDPT